jgi:hypothetical protein
VRAFVTGQVFSLYPLCPHQREIDLEYVASLRRG